MLVADQTGDLKKGTATAGVLPGHAGTAGRVQNAQVAVCLGYAARRGHALTGRELYLPKSWTQRPGPLRGRRDPRGRDVRDQAAAREADDRAGRRREGAVRLGRRR